MTKERIKDVMLSYYLICIYVGLFHTIIWIQT